MPRYKQKDIPLPRLPKDPEPMMIIHELSIFMRKSMAEKSRQLFGTEVCKDIIRALSRQDGITQLELVKITYYTAPAISTSLQRLEERGFVRRVTDEADRRAMRVYITEKGKAANLEMWNAIKEFDREVMIGIPKEQRKLLIETLLTMRKNVLPDEWITATELEK